MQLALTLALIPLAAAFAPAARSTPRASQLRMASPSVAIPPETVSLKHSSGASATIYKFGACVTSYVDADGNENLKVRPDAKMDGSKPISGGIPFCFPQFGPGAILQHGFAHNVDWDVTASKEDSVTFTLTPSEYSKEMWDHEFKCEYTVTLTGSALDTSFKVSNTGGAPFTFDAALHSYYDISSISKIAIAGAFKGSTFLNKMADPPADETEGRAEITIGEEYDRVYKGVSGEALPSLLRGKG